MKSVQSVAQLWSQPRRAWLLVGLILLFVALVRVRLREMPLERDEGEYAYAGQLILQGVPPYLEACNMKLPGTYAAYALIMSIFGQTPAGIHIGVTLVNIASVVLVFLLGRKLLDDSAGIVAAASFALMSLSPSVLGLAGHATHFVTLFALAGILLLIKALEDRSTVHNPQSTVPSPRSKVQGPKSTDSLAVTPVNPSPGRLFTAGLLLGLAFLMKQHGIFFGIFAVLFLLWNLFEPSPADKDKARQLKTKNSKLKTQRPSTLHAPRSTLHALTALTAGLALPYLFTCLLLWAGGAFHQFWFWTISYASKYASAVPLVKGPDLLRSALRAVAGPNLVFWLLPWAGALLMWWETRLLPRYRFFLLALLVCSAGSISVGFLFRGHYFITLLPVLSLLTGVAVSRSLFLVRTDRSIELFVAAPILLCFVLGLAGAVIGGGSFWLGMNPAEVVRSTYGSTLFSEAISAADYIKTNSSKEARVVVLGSEAELYFYSRRRSATGYLYMYPLMEAQPYALKMQEEMTAEIEKRRPEYVVYVDEPLSWLKRPESERRIFDWWEGYRATNLDLVSSFRFADDPETENEPPRTGYLHVYKRK